MNFSLLYNQETITDDPAANYEPKGATNTDHNQPTTFGDLLSEIKKIKSKYSKKKVWTVGTKSRVVTKVRSAVGKYKSNGGWGTRTGDPAKPTSRWGTNKETKTWKTWKDQRNSVAPDDVVIGLVYLGFVPIEERSEGGKDFRYVKVLEIISDSQVQVQDVALGKLHQYNIGDISRVYGNLADITRTQTGWKGWGTPHPTTSKIF